MAEAPGGPRASYFREVTELRQQMANIPQLSRGRPAAKQGASPGRKGDKLCTLEQSDAMNLQVKLLLGTQRCCMRKLGGPARLVTLSNLSTRMSSKHKQKLPN